MRWLLPWVALVGCRQVFGLDSPVVASDAAQADVAPAACTDQRLQCVGDVLRACESMTAAPVDTPCSWGCGEDSPGGARCLALQPAGGVLQPSLLTDVTGLEDTTIPGGGAILDTATGAISGVRAAGTGVVSGIRFTTGTTGNVFRMKSLVVDGPLATQGTSPIVLVVDEDVEINAVIDARGPCTGSTPGPGGTPGGPAASDGGGTSGGNGGPANADGAGGGGGNGGVGGNGGSATGPGGTGGPTWGDAAITVLVGGAGGGGGGDDAGGAAGGGGGGAIQIVSLTGSIRIAPGGGVNAGGCGGRSTADIDCGGGGGAGGTILLEAATVRIDGALAVNGGGGGTGDITQLTPGTNGRLDRTPAQGATMNANVGGAGAAGATSNGSLGMGGSYPGGGGGAIGRIRVNTRSGAATVGGTALMSPAFTDQTTATQGVANVQ